MKMYCRHCDSKRRVEARQNWNEVTSEDVVYMPSLEKRMPGFFSYAFHCVVCGQYISSCTREDYLRLRVAKGDEPHEPESQE